MIPSPYDHADCWLIREDAMLSFAVPMDVFYVQGRLCTNEANVPLMSSYARSEVGYGKFDGLARVFSPLISGEEDLERALSWYFGHAHDRKRPFVLIGEGEGGMLLQEYERMHSGELGKMGLAASFYTETAHKGFVTSDMVSKIRDALAKIKYRNIWGREMPGGGVQGGRLPARTAPVVKTPDSNDGSHAY